MPNNNIKKKPLINRLLAIIGALVSFVYLLNLTCGFLEIPDNLPIVGNLDEVAVSAFLFGCLNYVGINLIPFKGK